MRLQKIDADEFGDWLEQRFAASGIAPEEGLGAAIVDLAGNVPYDVQRLAHETWDDVHDGARGASVGLDDLHRTLTRLLDEQHTMFEESWQRLTLAQRAALRALVLEDGREMLSAGVRTKHRLAGRVERAGGAHRAREAGRRDEGRAHLRGDRFALSRVGGAEDVLKGLSPPPGSTAVTDPAVHFSSMAITRGEPLTPCSVCTVPREM